MCVNLDPVGIGEVVIFDEVIFNDKNIAFFGPVLGLVLDETTCIGFLPLFSMSIDSIFEFSVILH